MGIEIKGTKDFYNATAEQWANKWYSDETVLPLLKQFISLFQPHPRILDAGCGAGYESMRMKKLGADVVGADFSEESIRIAKKRNPDGEFIIMDMLGPDFSIGTFDGIAAIALLVHIERDNLQLIFNNFKKFLNASGFLFIAFVEGDGFSETRSYVEIDGIKYNRAFYLHRPETIIQIAESSGFKLYEEMFLAGEVGHWKYHIYQSV